ncbi:hypothetical protein SAMN05444673_6840 [Bacillus sp. OV166]|nr:hypothetical protein SAMN05444673_6840 [Bacillus sp. OV166]
MGYQGGEMGTFFFDCCSIHPFNHCWSILHVLRILIITRGVLKIILEPSLIIFLCRPLSQMLR